MKSLITTLAIAAAVLFSGCAGLPSPEEMEADLVGFELPQLPAEGEAMVYVVRPASVGWVIRFNVFVDNKEAESEIGYTRGSEYVYFAVKPGEHDIYSKAENWGLITLSAKAGDILFVEQEVNMGWIMARNTLTQIDELPGKYHVKHLELGTLR